VTLRSCLHDISLNQSCKSGGAYLVALVIAGLAVNEHRTGASSCGRESICVLLVPFVRAGAALMTKLRDDER
jgi:hypothetical protein